MIYVIDFDIFQRFYVKLPSFFRLLILAQHRTFPKLFATPTCKADTTGLRKSFSDFRFAKRLICGLWAVLWPNYFWAGLYTQAVPNTIKFAIFLKLKDCQLSICSILLAKHKSSFIETEIRVTHFGDSKHRRNTKWRQK